MTNRILRPLDYGGLFDELFDLYKKNILVFIGIAAIVYMPFNLLNSILSSRFPIVNPMHPPATPIDFDWAAYGKLWLFIVLSIPFTYAAVAAIVSAVSSSYLGTKPTILGSYKAIMPRIGAYILTVLLVMIALSIGLGCCCVPGIILIILLAFVPSVFVIENKGYIDAMRRSWELAKSEWVRVLVISIVTTVLAMAVQAVASTPFMVLRFLSEAVHSPNMSLAVIQGVVQGIASSLVAPLPIIAFVLLYYDIRVRKEGFDIEMLAQSMGAQVAASPASEEQPDKDENG